MFYYAEMGNHIEIVEFQPDYVISDLREIYEILNHNSYIDNMK